MKRKKSRYNKGFKKRMFGTYVVPVLIFLAVTLAAFVANSTGLLDAFYADGSDSGEKSSSGREVKQASGDADTTVTFVDVGQGDAALVQSDGHFMLIDTGDRDSDNTLIEYMQEQGVEKLDYLILTHPHADHIGEAAEIVEQFEIGKIIAPNVPDDLVPTSATYENLLDAMDEKGLKFRAARDETFTLGECEIDTYAAEGDYSNVNNYSVLVKIIHGENSFLITGDCEVQEEKEYLSRGIDLSADVLKAAHHGSDTSSSEEWLSEVSPQYTVISCGIDNRYGHPDDETYSRICSVCPNVYVTANDGTVIFESDGSGISAAAEK